MYVFLKKQSKVLDFLKTINLDEIKNLELKLSTTIEFISYNYRDEKRSYPKLHDRWMYFNHHLIDNLQDVLPIDFKGNKARNFQKKELRWRFDYWENVCSNSNDSMPIEEQKQILDLLVKKGTNLL